MISTSKDNPRVITVTFVERHTAHTWSCPWPWDKTGTIHTGLTRALEGQSSSQALARSPPDGQPTASPLKQPNSSADSSPRQKVLPTKLNPTSSDLSRAPPGASGRASSSLPLPLRSPGIRGGPVGTLVRQLLLCLGSELRTSCSLLSYHLSVQSEILF